MKYRYFTICTSYGDMNTYGIAVAVDNDGCFILVETFADISLDKESLERLVNMCNGLQLDPVHLRGIIDDFLT